MLRSSIERVRALFGASAILNNSSKTSTAAPYPINDVCKMSGPLVERLACFVRIVVVGVNAERNAGLCCGSMVSDMSKDDWRHAEPSHVCDGGSAQVMRRPLRDAESS